MSKQIKANIISLFLSLNAEEKKEVLAELKKSVQTQEKQGDRNISEEKI